ncbi:MAG TPA: protein kinase [Gemmataceae bacterium]|nr:protein kinase [Gemmataceae bacterium]
MPKTPPPTSATPPTVEGFLKTVLRSGLLDREALQTLLRTLPLERRNDADAVADHLVKAGRLTLFQARKLLAGASLGLALGPFHVLAPIAKGGMGTVYLARDTRSGQMVALKVLPPKKAREEERLLARFRREMEMCQRVSHPHLAWTYEVGVWHGVYYIAMEYIPGRSLYRLIHDEGPLPVPRAARLFAEVCLALDHAHNQGLIHRDLKPSNIIITPNDHAKVLDLGLALMEGELQGEREVIGGEGYVVGTMDYIAPEQTTDPSKVDPRCDVYSLGCTIYFTVTGRQPFPGGTSKDKIMRHRGEEPTPIPQLNANVPPAFIGLVRWMMVKDPENRLPSAAAARHELLTWADKGSGLPLDRPEDVGYEQAVALLEAKEPSAEQIIAEVLPADEEASPREEPPKDEALADAPPKEESIPEAIPVGIPVTSRPRPKRPSRVGLPDPGKHRARDESRPAGIAPWLLYAIPVAAGMVLGLVVLLLLWVLLRR